MNTAEDIVIYEGLVIWKKVTEYLIKNPTAMPARIAMECKCTTDLAFKFKNSWNKYHREAVLKSKAL